MNTTENSGFTCPTCAAPLSIGAAFCDNCGMIIPRCPMCDFPYAYGGVFCDNCGAQLPNTDIRQIAQDAVLFGSGAIRQDGGIAAGQSGLAVGRDIAGRDVIISYDTAYDRIVGSTTSTLGQLELNYKQTREQAQSWTRISLIAAGTGFVLIGIGVVVAIFGFTTAGIITAISSIIPNAIAALFFMQSRKADARVDAITSNLTEARAIQTAFEYANTIDDPKSRDKMKAEIVRRTLLLDKKSNIKGPNV
jgi:hypothetical protein